MSLRKFSMSPYYKALVYDFGNGQLSDSRFRIEVSQILNTWIRFSVLPN